MISVSENVRSRLVNGNGSASRCWVRNLSGMNLVRFEPPVVSHCCLQLALCCLGGVDEHAFVATRNSKSHSLGHFVALVTDLSHIPTQ